MAKKSNDDLYNDFLADLKKINPKIEEVLDEATNAKLKESVLARSEFSRQSDALAADRKEMENFIAQEKTKVEGWQKWYGDTSQQFANAANELKEYRDTYGALDSTSKRQVAESHGLTQVEFEKQLNDKLQVRDTAALSFVDALTDLKIDHRDRFKEKLDTAAVYKIAGEKNLPLNLAYNEYIGDRVAELNKAEMETRIKQEREAAVQEYVTKHNLPNISSSRDWVHAADATPAMTDPNARINAAVNDFMKRPQR